jgi:hypothetical protein
MGVGKLWGPRAGAGVEWGGEGRGWLGSGSCIAGVPDEAARAPAPASSQSKEARGTSCAQRHTKARPLARFAPPQMNGPLRGASGTGRAPGIAQRRAPPPGSADSPAFAVVVGKSAMHNGMPADARIQHS